MGIFDNMLLVSDFDGTLTGSDGRIPLKNLEKIRYFIENGGKFTISTGRTKVGFHNYSEEIINAPVLLGNGATAYDFKEGKSVFDNSINYSVLSVLNNIIEEFDFVGVEIYSVDDTVRVFRPDKKNLKHFADLKIENFEVIEIIDRICFPVVKIMLYAGQKSREVQDYLSKINLGQIKYIPCSGEFIEILSVTAGKGRALRQLAQRLNIPENRVFAVGDGSNDVDMLNAAEISFAPKGSDNYAIQAADIIVCESDKGSIAGVIDYLEKLIKT